MTTESNNAVEIQRKYYADTAAQYEAMHGTEGSADPLHMDFVIAMLRIRTSGRTLRTFRTALPDLFACGIEPVGPF
jgi:hypothetical protein